MKLKLTHVLIGVAVYEVVAYAFNSYQVSKPSVAGQAVFTLPFDFISTIMGGYATATNPTTPAPAVSGFGRLGAYMGQPAITLPTRALVP